MVSIVGYVIMNSKNMMSSKERVMTALRHEQPDRVPVNYFGTPEINQMLMEHFTAQSMDDVLKAIEIDLRVVNTVYDGVEIRPVEICKLFLE